MRLGVAFIAFSGLELLKPAIRNLRPIADFVTVVYSAVSNRGLPAPPYLEKLLSDLAARGEVDSLHRYEPTPPATSPAGIVAHMRRKRELARRVCERAGCTHVMIRDCDEFYPPRRLRAARWIADRYDITYSYSVDYTASPLYRWRHVRTHDCTPFIQRVEFPFKPSEKGPLTDPARTVAGARKRLLFPPCLLLMHHMKRVRFDEEELERKYQNHSWYARSDVIQRSREETRRPNLRNYRVLARDPFGILDYWRSEFRSYKEAPAQPPG